ncbi:hypothetical protein BLNAU_5827 [Blattamonas nauphoetae]|uniref:Uncharacterized protein n=1 Tax=Blattamonas nauphoetae TaxID=2049346 RepID=A0ABQ9Y6E3_9EUKA|nr:hypothetical protein BLNAU_5827 [Blattamonas nauphoetae]
MVGCAFHGCVGSSVLNICLVTIGWIDASQRKLIQDVSIIPKNAQSKTSSSASPLPPSFASCLCKHLKHLLSLTTRRASCVLLKLHLEVSSYRWKRRLQAQSSLRLCVLGLTCSSLQQVVGWFWRGMSSLPR